MVVSGGGGWRGRFERRRGGRRELHGRHLVGDLLVAQRLHERRRGGSTNGGAADGELHGRHFVGDLRVGEEVVVSRFVARTGGGGRPYL